MERSLPGRFVGRLFLAVVMVATVTPTAAIADESTAVLLVREPVAGAVSAVGNAASLGPTDEALARIGWRQIEVAAASADRLLARFPDDIELPVEYEAVRTPNDPLWSEQWGARLANAPQMWSASMGATSTVIAVLDTGVDEHADLEGKLLPGIDVVSGGSDASDRHVLKHGTSVALVAAGRGDNGVHAAGYCWSCSVLPVRVLDALGRGSAAGVAAGIVAAADRGADVINLSLGGPQHDTVSDAVAYAIEEGSLVVAAAGNSGTDTKTYPAAEPGVTAVGAFGSDGRLASYSNHGSWVHVAGPGCHPHAIDGLPEFCGTSAAAPAVAGALAVLRDVAPRAPARYVQALRTAVVPMGEVETGRIDLGLAVRLLRRGQPVPGSWWSTGGAQPGWYVDGTWLLRELDGGVTRFDYGRRSDLPLVGDWNGDGRETVGIVRDGEWHLKNRLSGGSAEIVFTYGRVTRGDIPLVGDWNGNRRDTVGIVRDGRWHLRNSLSGGPGEIVFTYGRVLQGDRPVIGDWRGHGRDGIGIVRGEGDWHVKDQLSGGPADRVFVYGRVSLGDRGVVGDWDGGGRTGVGVARDSVWFLKDQATGGTADRRPTF